MFMSDPRYRKEKSEAQKQKQTDEYRKSQKEKEKPSTDDTLAARAARRAAEGQPTPPASPPGASMQQPIPGQKKLRVPAPPPAQPAPPPIPTQPKPGMPGAGTGRMSLSGQSLTPQRMQPRVQGSTINRESIIDTKQLLEMRKQRKMMQK